MKDYAATIIIKFPVTFKAENMTKARERVTEVGKNMLSEKIRNSDLVSISSKDLQLVLLCDPKEEAAE